MSNEQKWAPWLVRVYNGWRCANTFAQGIRTSCCAFILQTTAWHRQLPTAVSSLGRMQKSFPPHFASLRPKKLVSDFRSSSSQKSASALRSSSSSRFFSLPARPQRSTVWERTLYLRPTSLRLTSLPCLVVRLTLSRKIFWLPAGVCRRPSWARIPSNLEDHPSS